MHTRGEPTFPPIHNPHRRLSKKTQLKLKVISQAWKKEVHVQEGSPRHEDAVDPSRGQERETPASLGSQACHQDLWIPFNRVFLKRKLSGQREVVKGPDKGIWNVQGLVKGVWSSEQGQLVNLSLL